MAIHRIIIEDSQGNKAKLSISADTLQAAIDKVKGYNPDMCHKVYGDSDERISRISYANNAKETCRG